MTQFIGLCSDVGNVECRKLFEYGMSEPRVFVALRSVWEGMACALFFLHDYATKYYSFLNRQHKSTHTVILLAVIP
jgi:hypothetical protein